jgi:spermidine/putrescine transport system permease protein
MERRFSDVLKAQIAFFLGAPAIIWKVIFLYTPLLFLVAISLVKSWNTFGFSQPTLEHYMALCAWAPFKIIIMSMIVAVATTVLCILLAYPVVYYLWQYRGRMKMFLFFLLILPFWINFLLHVYAWFMMLEQHGVVNNFLMHIGLISRPIAMLYSYFAIMLVMVHAYLPFMVFPLYSIVDKIDKQFLEASADLGASFWTTFFRVILPLSLPGLVTGSVLVFVASFAEFVIPDLVGGDRYMFVGNMITHYFLVAREASQGAAFTVISSLVVVGVLGGLHLLLRSKYPGAMRARGL